VALSETNSSGACAWLSEAMKVARGEEEGMVGGV
jgi:hypothetical protein